MNREHIRELADKLADNFSPATMSNYFPITEYNLATQMTRFFQFYLWDQEETLSRHYQLFSLILEEFEVDLMRFIYHDERGIMLDPVHEHNASAYPHAQGVDPVEILVSNPAIAFR